MSNINANTGETSSRYYEDPEVVDRHTVATYLSDALALERHIGQPLKRQLDMDASAKYGEALSLVSAIKALNDAHVGALETQLEREAGNAASPVKSAWSQIVGAGAAAIDSARKTKVSKNLRDDYTALSLAAISYTMLAATSLGLGDESTALLAQRHLADYAPIIVQISKAIGEVVLEELIDTGVSVNLTAAQLTESMTQAAWKSS